MQTSAPTGASAKPPSSPAPTLPAPRGALLRGVERFALVFEKPFTRIAGASTLNPFYHTGTLAVFLWLVVAATGVYLTLFYQFGFHAAYDAVSKMESQLLARVVRAVHRYASGTALIASVLHGFRLFFMDRFRGPRWLAWVTGVLMTAVLWLDGVSGYWLVWDQRTQLINESLTSWFARNTPWAAQWVAGLMDAERLDFAWILIALALTLHIALFLAVALFFWWHIMRLNRPRFVPPRYWMIGTALVVVLASALVPAGMLPRATWDRLPGAMTLDPFYLFFVPLELRGLPGWLWIGALGLLALATALPWVLPRARSATIAIDLNRCNGCTVCATDCPYKAITLAPRPDGKHKYIAVENPALCVACGICLGSCDSNAITLGTLSPDALLNSLRTRIAHAKANAPASPLKVIVTCERHAAQAARGYTSQTDTTAETQVAVIALPCIGSAPPNLTARALDFGANEVALVGCPPDDCAQREGNTWTAERLTRKRLPRLRPQFVGKPIAGLWLAPDAFADAVRAPVAADEPTRIAQMTQRLTWRNFAPAFALLGVLVLVQVLLTSLPFQAFPSDAVRAQMVLPQPAQTFARLKMTQDATLVPTRIVLRVDDQIRFEHAWLNGDAALYHELSLPPGKHRVRLSFDDAGGGSVVVFDQTAEWRGGENIIVEEPYVGVAK